MLFQMLLLPVVVMLLERCATSSATTLEVQIHYPASKIEVLENNAVFTLALSYQAPPSSDTMWNQSIPGAPYDPILTIFQDDYKGNDTFVKQIELEGDNDVFVAIYAANAVPGNPFEVCAVKDFCNKTALDPVSQACVHVGMPYRSVRQEDGKALIVAYPYFGMAASGSVYTLLPELYSPQLFNYRDINIYVPPSLVQNPLPREVSVLIINDGTLYFLEQLAVAGGMNHASLTGAVPETIMIGVPQNATGGQRQFELTFSVSAKDNGRPMGGTDLYLAFIQETVVPAVTAALGVVPGEMSMAGVSYGGLTSCYAAAAQPLNFRRAFCQSPSTWWNFGELGRLVTANAAVTENRPLAVVVYIGTTEMSAPNCVDVACTSTTSWFNYVNDTVEAFRRAGGAHLTFFTLTGGYHDATAWATTFETGVTQMYSVNFTAKYQMQYSAASAINIVLQTDDSADANSCPGEVRDSSVAGLAAQFDNQNTVSNARFNTLAKANKVMADKIDALTAMLGSIPPMIAECTAARRARAAGTGSDGDEGGGGGGDSPAITATDNNGSSSSSNTSVTPTADGSGSQGGRVAGTVVGVLIAIAAIVGIAVLYKRGSFDTLCDKFCLGGGNGAYKRAAAPTGISSPAGAGARGARLNTAAVANASYQANHQAETLHSTA